MSLLSKAFKSVSHAVSHTVQQVPIVGKPINKLVNTVWQAPATRGIVVGAATVVTGGAALGPVATYAAGGAAAGAAYESAAGGSLVKGALIGGGLGYGVASYEAGALTAGAATKLAAGGAVLTGAGSPKAAVGPIAGAVPGDFATSPSNSGIPTNPSLWDSAVNYFGKQAANLINPGAAETANVTAGAQTPAPIMLPIKWGWVAGGIIVLGVAWLLMSKR